MFGDDNNILMINKDDDINISDLYLLILPQFEFNEKTILFHHCVLCLYISIVNLFSFSFRTYKAKLEKINEIRSFDINKNHNLYKEDV